MDQTGDLKREEEEDADDEEEEVDDDDADEKLPLEDELAAFNGL